MWTYCHCSHFIRFQHLENVLEAYKSFGGLGFFNYDESFRQKLSIHHKLKWGMKDVGLWLNLMLASNANTNRQPLAYSSVSPYRKGVCYAYNESQCQWNTACKYKHECSHCSGNHPVAKCFKRANAVSKAQHESSSKRFLSCDYSKHVPLAGQIPRQGDGSAHN